MEHIVIRERDIRNHPAPGGDWSEDNIRTFLERNGINFGQTTFVRGEQPNREWTNARVMFMPSDAETARVKAEQEERDAILRAEHARKAESDAAKDKEIADLRAKLEALSAVKEIAPVQAIPAGDPLGSPLVKLTGEQKEKLGLKAKVGK